MGCCLKKERSEKPAAQQKSPNTILLAPDEAEMKLQKQLGIDPEVKLVDGTQRDIPNTDDPKNTHVVEQKEPVVRSLAPTILAQPISPSYIASSQFYVAANQPPALPPVASESLPPTRPVVAEAAVIELSELKAITPVRASVIPQAPAGSKRPFSLKEVFDVLNAVRAHPENFAETIQTKYIDDLDDSGVLRKKGRKTKEGLAVFQEAKRFLETASAVPPLTLDCGLTAAAYLHSCYMSETNNLTHTGRGGTDAGDRIDKFGRTEGLGEMGSAENIFQTSDFDPVDFVLYFVIDDGVQSRGHRENLFLPEMHKVGLGVKEPPTKHKHWYFTMDFAYETYKGQKSMIPANVMEESGLNDYSRATGITF